MMSIVKLEWPTSGTPTVPTDYTYQNNNLERAARGEGVTLSNWDATTTAPEVSVGSTILTNGVYYYVTTGAETISTSGASSGTIYLIFDDTDGSEEFAWTDTAPTWDAALNGWYVSGDRFTGHFCTWDGSSAFTDKAEYARNNQAAGGAITPLGFGLIPGNSTEYNELPSDTTPFVLPRGVHYISSSLSYGLGGDENIRIEIYDGTSWELYAAGSSSNGIETVIISDGEIFRLSASASTTFDNRWIAIV